MRASSTAGAAASTWSARTAHSTTTQLEANYYAGINEQPATITETITEVNGQVTQYRYLNVLFKLDDAGSKAGDQTVKQKLSFVAARRTKIA